ncbi:Gcn5-related n-acetyltransferase [Globisporangium polare]
MAPIQAQTATVTISNQETNSDELSSPPTITIRQFRDEDLSQVLVLFRDGLMSYTHEDDPLYKIWVEYIASSLKKDLADILGHYVAHGGNFWVATAQPSSDSNTKDHLERESEVIVGTLAIQRHSTDVGELRRVSVREDHRRFGIGRQLFLHAQEWARDERKLKVLKLSCSVKQVQAHRFYEAHGFQYTHTSVMCAGPLFENVHYEKWV